jgi:hypothetical protein
MRRRYRAGVSGLAETSVGRRLRSARATVNTRIGQTTKVAGSSSADVHGLSLARAAFPRESADSCAAPPPRRISSATGVGLLADGCAMTLRGESRRRILRFAGFCCREGAVGRAETECERQRLLAIRDPLAAIIID